MEGERVNGEIETVMRQLNHTGEAYLTRNGTTYWFVFMSGTTVSVYENDEFIGKYKIGQDLNRFLIEISGF